MHKRTIALIVVAIVVVAVVGYTALGLMGTVPPLTQLTQLFNTSTSTTASTTVTTSPTTVSTTTIGSGQKFQGCLASGPTQTVPYGTFSSGTYAGWNVTGTGFGPAPQNITSDNSNTKYYGSPWSGYNGLTFFASTYQGGTKLTEGNLTSQTFEVTEPYLNFRIVSAGSQSLYVEVLRNNTPAITSYYDTFGSQEGPNGSNSSIFRNASIPVATLLCKNVTIRVVGDVVSTLSNSYDYIAIGGFYLSRTPLNTPGILQNQVIANQS